MKRLKEERGNVELSASLDLSSGDFSPLFLILL